MPRTTTRFAFGRCSTSCLPRWPRAPGQSPPGPPWCQTRRKAGSCWSSPQRTMVCFKRACILCRWHESAPGVVEAGSLSAYVHESDGQHQCTASSVQHDLVQQALTLKQKSHIHDPAPDPHTWRAHTCSLRPALGSPPLALATRTYKSRHASSSGASSGNQPSVAKSASRAATRPPGTVTRRASRSAPTGSLMCCSTCQHGATLLVDRDWCPLDCSSAR